MALRVEAHGTETGGLVAHEATFLIEFDCRPEAEAPREMAACCLLGRELFAKESRKSFAHVVWHHHVPRDRREHDQGVHCVGTIHDEFKVVDAPTAEVFW